MNTFAPESAKADLHRYLQRGREALVWKLDGLSDYDIRRPLVASGTNLLGLVKHLAYVEYGYFGATFGRPVGGGLDWSAEEEEAANSDMWATAAESRKHIVALYQRAWEHSDLTISHLSLGAEGVVPWWNAPTNHVTLHQILVHTIAETHRHVGHADLVRELIDGKVGLQLGNENMPEGDSSWWNGYTAGLQAVAEKFKP